ncbi:ferredoxin [Streptomyces sp. NPDC047928]|uniref:ferredoxin n=1 Tax=unclassified Streptomyces TaxID=2593676 RepID=UPI003721241A
MGDRWHVEVDRTVCVGSAQCLHHAPGAFRLDAGRQAHPVEAETDAAEEILTAAESCPVEAIALKLLGSGEPIFPSED